MAQLAVNVPTCDPPPTGAETDDPKFNTALKDRSGDEVLVVPNAPRQETRPGPTQRTRSGSSARMVERELE